MKGQVLGFDGANGAINGEDGKRYRFSKEHWRDERPAASKDQVDFVADGEEAREIYRVSAGLSMSLPKTDSINPEKVQAARGFLAVRPQIIFAAVLLFASVFMNFMGDESGDEGCCVSLTGVHTVYAGIGQALDMQAQVADQTSRMFGGGESMVEQIAKRRHENGIGNTRGIISALTWVSYALWLIPIGAGLIIFREIKSNRHRGLELIVGVGSLIALMLIPINRAVLSHATDGVVGYALNHASTAIGFSFGAVIIALMGLGLIGTSLGRITRTPGL